MLNNRYEILKTLGRGGFGETFLAIDTGMPSRRQCVIKQLKPTDEAIQAEPTPGWFQERFQREAAILEELGRNNPQIPQLYAYFSEGENFFFVQEWIEGITLSQKHQKEGNLSEAEVEKILRELLPVLDHIHSRNPPIIHRDIKPDNIILRASDGKPVLIDFGIVKEVNNINSTTTVSLGTPGYMASEQAAGRPVPSSDLYSLGLTAIFLLTGKIPQDLTSHPKTGEILWRQDAPHRPSNLAAVIDRAVRFHPRDRFTSAEEMLTSLSGSSQPTVSVNQSSTTTSPPRPLPPWFWVIFIVIIGGLSFRFGHPIIKPWLDSLFPNEPTVEKLPLIKPSSQINSFVLNEDGQTLLGGDEKGNIYLWDVATGKRKKTIAGHGKAILEIAISNDQQILASSSEDGTIKVWDLKTGKERITLPNQRGLIALALSSDGNTLVTGGEDATVKLWNLSTGNLIETLPVEKEVVSLAINQDASIIVSGHSGGDISFWQKQGSNPYEPRIFPSINPWTAPSVAVSADGTTAASSSCQENIRIWKDSDWKDSPLQAGSSADICLIVISEDGKIIAGRSSDETIRLWNLNTKKEIFSYSPSSPKSFDSPRMIALSGDGRTVASNFEKKIQVWRPSF
ncbi:MAG: SpkC protein [Microcystis aeruginosa Ma_AC_P_19900807_S299]|uniref:non-specific serine/threonine protein kinase n=1 Tax=Microcystis aeruginosa Ma_SC_T_19800800_S464 TaxID=2486257 RepID=A0A552DSJ2_MICAE|nr:MAG: SpkC protein [Microcystis aeruginosa Ma_AC_P_19900807_S299]TRU25202.1 MAG: SpkC protein [Microcystis aeruginosa Ma_SC_T_19800800_S464]